MWKPLALILVLASPAAAQAPALPVHGNWCGPGWGAGPALDALDAACRRHDFCVSYQGSQNCGCDLGFMQELRRGPFPNPAMADKARAIYEAIALVPCTDPAGQATKTEMLMSDWMNGVMYGAEAPWAVLERLGKLAATAIGR